nr:GPCR kinase [Tanacetum cinerariifolium]
MDFNFNNENDQWGFGLDIDDFDLHLTPVLRSSSSTCVEPSPLTPNPVRIIHGHAGIVQLSSSTRVEPSLLTPNPVRIIPGHASIAQQAKLLKKRFLLIYTEMTMKDLSGIIPRTIHYKVIGDGGYGKDITVGDAMILDNVSVFTHKPSKHYLNITMRMWLRFFVRILKVAVVNLNIIM